MAWKNVFFPARKLDFPLFVMYFFISKVKISLQLDKFPGNDLAKMPIFSHHGKLSKKLKTGIQI